MVTLQLLRNATLVVEMDNKKILVDPMLGAKGAYNPVPWTSNGIRNPTVRLPLTQEALQQIVQTTDAVLVTHTHNDHWDEAARQLLSKDILLMGQPEDEALFKQQGFLQVVAIDSRYRYANITITRTGGRHGKGEIGAKMAPVSGFVLDNGVYRLYIAGDTIWCEEVEKAIRLYQPDAIVINAGAAQFDMGEPITMNAADVLTVCEKSTAPKIVCVHMEAVNHCYLKRAELRNVIRGAGEQARCLVPEDGETIVLAP